MTRGHLRGSLQILLPLLLTAAIFGIWDLVVWIFDIQPYVLPTPRAVFSQIGTDSRRSRNS
jgi:ABC-type nitrate/sulfonate/bicarbonate transport system permease component